MLPLERKKCVILYSFIFLAIFNYLLSLISISSKETHGKNFKLQFYVAYTHCLDLVLNGLLTRRNF